jgi:hypothetical protein
VEKARVRVALSVESAAIEAFAQQGEFNQALKWLANYDPGNQLGGWPDWVYGQVILQMLAQRQYGEVQPAISQCTAEGDGFPFWGAATAIAPGGLPWLERSELASQGLQAAGSTRQVVHAARFLAAVHAAFPGMDSAVEDAIVSELRFAASDMARHPNDSENDERGGTQLLALLGQINPHARRR